MALDRLGLREDQQIVVAAQILCMVREALAAKIAFLEW